MTRTLAATDLGSLHELSAADAARLIRDDVISSEQLVSACLERVKEVDARVQAWAFLGPAHARAQACAADQLKATGRLLGPLHGVPIGLKDIIDTADMPTENGSVLHAGRTPSRDAAVVTMLRAAGAVIMGKTVTTEFATRHPGKTRNPHDPGHTPGGSSSGSAAAVAAGMVPLSLGSQTTGSTIRPASYCGVYGFKPTHGLIPRPGMFQLSRTLDHVGLFARSLDDLALLLETLAGHDAHDPDTRPRAHVAYRALAADALPRPPMLAFAKTTRWSEVDSDARDALTGLVKRLGAHVEEIELPPAAGEGGRWQEIVSGPEMAASLAREWATGREQLSAALRTRIERGRAVPAVDYLQTLARLPELRASLAALLEPRYDAILTPTASGTAPAGLHSTGEPTFCALWTLCGMPALSLPLLHGANGLPLGVQLVGPRGGDAALLRTARWLVESARG